MSDEIEVLKKTAQIYCDKVIPVHIVLKSSGGAGWQNGYIQEVAADFIMLEEREDGLMPVFFLNIKRIETYVMEVKK